MAEFEEKLKNLDTSLFDSIATQSCDGDRKAWLAIQRSMRHPDGYVYLEIGSHLGGSIQQHLQDPFCKRIISVDKRPLSQPDDRGQVYHYEGNSTARMLDNLKGIGDVDRIQCFDQDISEVQSLDVVPDVCFIDGEHTVAAVVSDYNACMRLCSPNAAIYFHDDNVVWPAIRSITRSLISQNIPFAATKMTGVSFGIFLRNCPAASDPYLQKTSLEGIGWLQRRAVARWIPRALHPIAARIRGALFKQAL